MKTSEMIAMLEKNPKLKFRRSCWGVGVTSYITISPCGNIACRANAANGIIGGWTADISVDDWQLVREPVPAWEAIKALSEGETVICEYTEPFNSTVRKFKIARGDLEGFAFHAELLFKGTWYIND